MFLAFQYGWYIIYNSLQRVLAISDSDGVGDTFIFLVFGVLIIQVI